MKKVLLFGDYTNYQYHPLQEVEKELKNILYPSFDVIATENYDIFNAETLSESEMLILYGDRWNALVNTSNMAAIISYVSLGGALLVIHNGISFQENFEFMQMVGAKFNYHPDEQDLVFYGVGEHPVINGCSEMKLFEEPYQFEFCPHTKKSVFLEYEMNGIRYPAGWSVRYCMGKIIYLMPGHSAEALKNRSYRSIILQAANWLTERL